MDTSPADNPTEQVKARLHRVFDSQIPNFASYNLVAGTGIAGSGGLKVIGYRQQPAELVLAPVNSSNLTASEDAITINNTNVNQLALLNDGEYEVATSTGRVFRFSIPSHPSIDLQLDDAVSVAAVIDQEVDAKDFADFMDHFMNTIEGTENFV
ncbi:hypothetical protein [Glutamicibacter protophormiae]|uniref:Uncharacterized protein n=1 Tax=Glutamicibacter protophormiae TaxID=37930 RepID=A0ABS4XS74_GLUPR|nr:hypothetical protein [Glutamicibacter protophormiae]MBP2399362.1 hypothetical protein [Glutamicibacter protophormiae]QRQ79964.1 hypothetical protein JQN66_07095 [Glutamicibacter protophormiae]WPR66074.1 hypothetical protein SLW72_07090 [Glutamicibacter protophormiae]WPR69571.1 hypothetical protein SLW73_07085 [Glutamicibacter protophormiae]GGL85421.1 hypothetical protein GCM10010038_14230 [Glutamicibacter protophormiae]